MKASDILIYRAHNLIIDINGTALLTLQRLQNLDISGNKISVIRNGSFLAPNCLTHLYVTIYLHVVVL